MVDLKGLEAAVLAHDKEDAAMRGEPDPWRDDRPEQEFSDRIFAMDIAIRAYLSAITPAEVSGLVERLNIKAGVMEMGERIAWGSDTTLMREAATALEAQAAELAAERAAHAETKRERDEAEAQRDEALKDVVWLLDAFQDEREAFLGRELRDGDLPPEWHRAARRALTGGQNG